MNPRIAKRFETVKQEKRSAFITFTMAFDPDLETSQNVLESLPEAGADIIELGMPFSDPMADGPAIQEAGIRALKSGAKLSAVLKMVEKFRQKDQTTPIILMGYYNPVQHYDVRRFSHDAKEAGVDGLIIVDVPPEEDDILFAALQEHGIDLIRLVTPTTDAKRLATITQKASGFLYYVAVAGVTGTKSASYESIKKAVNFIKSHSDLPLAVGFGITSPEDVKAISQCSDAVVVGSALVKTLHQSGQEAALSFVKRLHAATAKA